MSTIRGRYPGGPSRQRDPEDDTPRKGKVRLSSVEEIEGRAAAGSQARRTQARRKRLLVGLFLSLSAALALGGYLGFSSHRSASEIANEMEGQTEVGKSDLDRQMDRMIDEMWKSEALEKKPRIR